MTMKTMRTLKPREVVEGDTTVVVVGGWFTPDKTIVIGWSESAGDWVNALVPSRDKVEVTGTVSKTTWLGLLNKAKVEGVIPE